MQAVKRSALSSSAQTITSAALTTALGRHSGRAEVQHRRSKRSWSGSKLWKLLPYLPGESFSGKAFLLEGISLEGI